MPGPGPAPIPEPDVEEAAVVLFAAAEGTEAPAADVGPTFEEKRREVLQDKREYKENLAAAVVLSPFMIFILLTLPILGYAILKFVRREPIETDDYDEQQAFRKASGGLMLWWVLGINVPVVMGVLAVIVGNITRKEEFGFIFLGFALFALITAFVLLIISVVKVRRAESSKALPLLRKVVVALPAVYLFWGIYLVALVIGAEERVIEGQTFFTVALAGLGLLALVGGAISIARNCAMHKVSGGRMVWLGVSRSCLSGVSCILLLFMVSLGVGGDALAKVERATMDGVMEGGMDMDMAMPMMAVAEKWKSLRILLGPKRDGIRVSAGRFRDRESNYPRSAVPSGGLGGLWLQHVYVFGMGITENYVGSEKRWDRGLGREVRRP